MIFSFEPTNNCNLKCPQCPTGMGILKRRTGYMDLSLYRSIINSISDSASAVQLFFQGEPFLQKDLPEMIRYADEKKLYTITSTNGHFLSEETVKSIFASNLKVLVIGLDGIDSETYEKYRKNGDFNKVIKGIELLIRKKTAGKTEYPKIVLQFLVFKNNEKQIDKIREFGKNIGADKVLIKSAQIYEQTDVDDFLPENSVYSRYKNDSGSISLKTDIPNHCKRLWTTSVLTWDGITTPCCFDKDAEYAFGDLTKTELDSVWNGESAKHFRKKILADRTGIPMCNNCIEGLKIYY
ncbi:radical SAM/SPASM domain-containing protein [candidate division KSB1 bacterium]